MESQLLKSGFLRINKEKIPELKKQYILMKEDYASSIDLFSIFSWDDNLPAYYKIIYDYLCFIIYDKINLRWVSLPPIGDYEKKEIIDVFTEIENFFTNNKIMLIYTDVSTWMLPYFNKYFAKRSEITDCEDLREYIYSMEEFKAGLNQQGERYNYNYFLKKNNILVKDISPELEKDCIKIIEASFCNFHSCEDCEYGCLKDTLHRALLICDNKDYGGFIVYTDDTPIAYNMVSREGKQLVFHFKKNIRGFRGINEYIHKESVERFGEGCVSINYTEDMGLEGLKKYKSNLCAYHLSSKLEISIKSHGFYAY